MFKITNGKGFHVIFKNGITVSVQFGKGNYCNNRYKPDNPIEVACANAEIAMWHEDGSYIECDTGYNYHGHLEPEEVLKYLVWAEAQPAKEFK